LWGRLRLSPMTNQEFDGQKFDGKLNDKEHAALALLIARRWGGVRAGAVAWRRLFQNTATDRQFEELVKAATEE